MYVYSLYISVCIHVNTLLATGEEYFVWGACIRYCFVAGIISCVLGSIKYSCCVIRGHFLVESKYAEFGIVFNSCTGEPGYWLNHVNYILAINPTATMVLGVKCYNRNFVQLRCVNCFFSLTFQCHIRISIDHSQGFKVYRVTPG